MEDYRLVTKRMMHCVTALIRSLDSVYRFSHLLTYNYADVSATTHWLVFNGLQCMKLVCTVCDSSIVCNDLTNLLFKLFVNGFSIKLECSRRDLIGPLLL